MTITNVHDQNMNVQHVIICSRLILCIPLSSPRYQAQCADYERSQPSHVVVDLESVVGDSELTKEAFDAYKAGELSPFFKCFLPPNKFR